MTCSFPCLPLTDHPSALYILLCSALSHHSLQELEWLQLPMYWVHPQYLPCYILKFLLEHGPIQLRYVFIIPVSPHPAWPISKVTGQSDEAQTAHNENWSLPVASIASQKASGLERKVEYARMACKQKSIPQISSRDSGGDVWRAPSRINIHAKWLYIL